MSETNWYVITGAPASGKTTLVEELERRGCRVVHEVARAYIEMQMAQGQTLEEIRSDKRSFENWILDRKIAIEDRLPRNEVIIFDRAVPDSIAYFDEAGLDPGEAIQRSPRNRYRGVFLLDRLPFRADRARIEDDQMAQRLHTGIERSYRMLGYEVTGVEVMSVAERLAFVVKHIERTAQKGEVLS